MVWFECFGLDGTSPATCVNSLSEKSGATTSSLCHNSDNNTLLEEPEERDYEGDRRANETALYRDAHGGAVDMALECNYEENCTILYKMMEAQRWPQVIEFLDTGLWSTTDPAWQAFHQQQQQRDGSLEEAGCLGGSLSKKDETTKQTTKSSAQKKDSATNDTSFACGATTVLPCAPGYATFKDPMSPSTQVRTWVTRFEKDSDYQIKWSQLPLHLALVMDAPVEVVRRLVRLYPVSIRCTDDQHMLPLHLSLRQGCSDEVVDFLTHEFPEAIHAKGKEHRSVVDCAMRSRKRRARARMLNYFVQANHDAEGRELYGVKSLMDEKDAEIYDLHSKLTDLETVRSLVEYEMAQKIEELALNNSKLEAQLDAIKLTSGVSDFGPVHSALERYHSASLAQEQKDRNESSLLRDLDHTTRELSLNQQRAQQQEERLRRDLEDIEIHIARSKTEDDLTHLKRKMETLKTFRLEHTKASTKEEIDSLKARLRSNQNDMSTTSSTERKLTDLQSREAHAETSEELQNLSNDMALLKNEMRRKRELARTKADLVSMKQNFVNNLNSRWRTGGQSQVIAQEDAVLEQLKTILASKQVSSLEKMSPDELVSERIELAKLKSEIQTRLLHSQVQQDFHDLNLTLAEQLETSTLSNKKELRAVEKAVKKINDTGFENKSNVELLEVKMEILALREKLREKDLSKNIKQDVQKLRDDVDAALKHTDKAHRKELHDIKKASYKIGKNKVTSTSVTELRELRERLSKVKKSTVPREEITKVKEELIKMRRTADEQIKENDGTTKQRLQGIKKEIDTLNSTKTLEGMNREQMDDTRSKIAGLWGTLADIEELYRTKQDLYALQRHIDAEVVTTTGYNRLELLSIKEAIDGINMEELQAGDPSDWRALKEELEAVKVDMKKKELRSLKMALKFEMDHPSSRMGQHRTAEDLLIISKAYDEIDLMALERASNTELNLLKMSLDSKLSLLSSAGVIGNNDALYQAKASSKKKRGLFGRRGGRNDAQTIKKQQITNTPPQNIVTTATPPGFTTSQMTNNNHLGRVTTLLPPSVPNSNNHGPLYGVRTYGRGGGGIPPSTFGSSHASSHTSLLDDDDSADFETRFGGCVNNLGLLHSPSSATKTVGFVSESPE